MRASKIWGFIGSNVISLVTILAGVVVIVLDQMGLLSSTVVSSTILGLLALLATSEIIESRGKLSKLEEKLEDLSEQVIEATQGVSVLTFPTNAAALEYIAQRLRKAEHSVDIAALDRRRSRPVAPLKKYYKAREFAILSNEIKFRYVGVLYTARRLERCLKYLSNPKVYNYFVGFYLKPSPEIPLITFTIIDRKEVFTRYPFRPGADEGYIVIRSPYVANLFLNYFEELWNGSQKVETEEDYKRLLSLIV